MKGIKTVGMVAVGYLLTMQQVFAGAAPELPCLVCDVPEIDGSGAIIAIGLVAGLIALIREKFYNK